MSASPLVSVCIQTFNHEKYIRQCLESVLEQETDFEYEIIVGEDDSGDSTRSICMEYAEKYPDKIKLFLRSGKDKIKINGELTGRYNFLSNLRAASGKYIALLDGDDYWCDMKKLQRQFDLLEDHPECSLCFHQAMRCKGSAAPYRQENIHLPKSVHFYDQSQLLKNNLINTASSFFKREHIDEIPGWFYEVPFIDYPLHIFLSSKGRIAYLPQSMAVYRIHRGGMWSGSRAPVNLIRLWYLHTIMANNLKELKDEFESKRLVTGQQLIEFYKTHQWKDHAWFEKELNKREFEDDELLLVQLKRRTTMIEHARSVINRIKLGIKIMLRRE